MDIVGDALSLLNRATARASMEARFAATLLKARGPGVAVAPPLHMLGVLRSLDAYGPIAAAVALAAATQPHDIAIMDEQGSITFGELDAQSTAVANALHHAGFGADGTRSDSIGILARNHRGLFIAIFAAAKLGARTLLLNTDFAGPQLVDVCKREDVCALIHDAEFSEIAVGYEPPLGRVLAWSDENTEDDATTLSELAAAGDTTAPPRPARKQRIVLLTSGTTGTPKGAPRDLALSLAIPGGYLSKIPLRSGRAVFLAAPGFHAWGLLSSMLALGLGNTVIMTRRFDAKHTVAALEHHGCDALITVPILLSRLLAVGEEELGRHDLSRLRVIAVSGSALSPDLAERTMDQFGDILYNLYGSTEVAYATIATPADMRAAPGTVGKPPFGTVIKLFDENGDEVPAGASGRIFVGNSIQFEGYTGGGDKERIAGLMSTGDVGHLDEEGRLFVDGRDDDMIVSGGENVFPAEIEDLLGAHEQIAEAAVIGRDDPDFGKRLHAYVVRADGSNLDEETVKEYVKQNLARYKVPRGVTFLDQLPRNPAGKIVKRDLPDD